MTYEERRVQAVEKWLRAKRITYWQGFTLTKDDTLRAAAVFALALYDEMGPVVRGVPLDMAVGGIAHRVDL